MNEASGHLARRDLRMMRNIIYPLFREWATELHRARRRHVGDAPHASLTTRRFDIVKKKKKKKYTTSAA